MKRFLCRYGIWVAVLALAAGIFYALFVMRTEDLSERGTLVRAICRENSL